MLRDFLKAIVRHWVNWVSGLVGVILWIVGYFAEQFGLPNWTSLSFWWGACLALALAVYSLWSTEHKELVELQVRLRGFPRLLVTTNSFRAGIFFHGQTRYSVLRLTVVNQPLSKTPESVAREVLAKLTFYDGGDRMLFSIPAARWEGTVQPPDKDPNKDIVEIIAVRIVAGQERELNIVCKEAHKAFCYGLSNDSYEFWFEHPNYKMDVGVYRCIVELSGHYVDTTIELKFENPDGQDLRVIDVEQIPL